MHRKRFAVVVWATVSLLAAAYLTGVALLSQWAVGQMEKSIKPLNGETRTLDLPGDERAAGPLFLDEDALMWLLHAEHGLQERSYRVRSTNVDNVPFGREMHWSSGTIWFLQIGGSLYSMLFHRSIHESLALVALWWNPVVHWGVVFLASGLIARSCGWRLALLGGVTLTTLPTLHLTCHTARPDHHGLQATFVVLSFLLPILGGLGWVKAKSESERFFGGPWPLNRARWWMVIGGLAAGAGLWVGSMVETVALVGLGVGVSVWFWLERRSPAQLDGATFDPTLWRWWGWSGAAASLAFYFLEYFPSHMTMRLEVNHPWYAACLGAAGEIFCRLSRLTFARRDWRKEGPVIGLALLTLVSLPLGLWLGPSEWHSLKDPWMRRMHEGILEFLPYSAVYGESAWRRFWTTFGILPLFLAVGAYALAAMKPKSWERGGLAVLSCSSLLFLICLLLQYRWAVFFGTTVVLLAVLICKVLPAKSIWSTGVYGLLLLQALLFGWLVIRTAQAYGMEQNDPELAASTVFRRTAAAWQEARGSDKWRIFCEPTDGPMLAYYSGIPVLTSFYWENMEGLRAAVLFMTDSGDEEARKIALDRGLTHVILNETSEPAKFYQHVRYGTVDLGEAKASLAGRLSRRQPPAWLQLDESLTEIAQRKYQGKHFVLNEKFLVYKVNREAIK